MKIKSLKLPFTKKSALFVCFFACMFIFASFTKEDILKIRKWKTKWKTEKNQKTDGFFDKPTDFPLLKGLSNFNSATVSQAEINDGLNLNPNSIADENFILKEKDDHINDENITTENSNSFSAIEKEGTIGIFSHQEEDRAKDNFFTVNLPKLNENSRVFLSYELYGLASHESVSRSINQDLSIGGEIIIPSAVWSQQKEELNSSVLKEGVNTILFTSPSSGIKYKVRNLKIVFEKGKKEKDFQINSVLSGDHLYIKGYSRNIDLKINNSEVSWNKGEFEKIIKLSAEEKVSGYFSVSHNGSSQVFKLPSDEKSFKVIGNNVYNYKTIDVVKDQEADINYEDLNLKVEKDAAESASLEIIKLREKDIPSVSGGLKNITINNSGYRFSVKSGKLNKKVKITIPYDDKKLGLISPKEIKVFSFDYNKKQWKVVGESNVDQKNKTVTFEGDGDGDYINGVISLPESPQTNSFSPTTISGLQTADPTAGLQFLSPPTASQKGDANLSYPIVIPNGRNGLQPNLSITYSSNASNGWMGEGWNIEGISSIELDTKWGAPEFDSKYETELYSLNGEMLVYPEGYLPHRHKQGKIISTAKQTRNSTGAKKFYLRRNHDFSIIERYGNSPNDYRWAVTSPNGTKSYYGGDENSVDNQSVLRSPSGAISKWGIYKVEDTYRNNVKYYYDNYTLPGQSTENANLSGGNVFNIKTITYTGKDGSDGGYSVVFNKENSIIRKDLIINAKQGVKVVEPNRLTEILIFNNIGFSSTQNIKSYHFFYTEGEFSKSLMNKFYVAGQEHYINTYNFDYHNELKNGTTVLPSYGPDTSINTYQADSSLFNLPSGHNPSKISTTYTKEEGATFRLGILLDFVTTTQNPYGNIILMSLLNGSSRARAKGAHELVDFNGDGIPDIVYKKNDGLYMRPGNISDTGSLTGFGIERKIENLSSNFSYTDTKTKSRGKDFGGSISFLNWSIFANTSTISSSSKSTTPTYLIDANSDGLMDVVDGKEVWFNRIVNGGPSFTKYSYATENMVITANAVEPPTLEMLPTDDVIKFWIAPKDGYIRLHDEISVENVNGANAVYSIEVPVTINNVTTTKRIYLTKLIAGGSMQTINIRRYNDYFSQIQAMPPYNAFNHLGYDSSDRIFVKSGQKVYIRLHQNENDNYKVNSNPEIVYVDPSTGNDIPNNNLEEQDGFNLNNGSYSTNFMLNNHDMGLKLNQPGNITINVPTINFDRLNDDVKIRFVVQGLVSSQLTELNSITRLQSASPVTISPYSINSNISEPSVLMCYVESLSHIQYKDTNINNIKVNYTTGGSSYDLNLVPTLNSYYVKDLKPKINLDDHTNISPVDPKTYGVQINKNIIFNQTLNNSPDFSFAYVIKKKGLVLGKRKVFITHTNNSASLYEVDLATNQVINGIQPIPFFTGQFSDASFPDERISIQVYVQNAWDASLFNVYKSILNQKIFNVYYDQNVLLTSIPETSVNSEVFNPVSKIYKNWGQFLYRNEDIPDKMGNSCKIIGKCDEYGVLIDDLRDPVMTINTSSCNHITDPNDMQACVAQNSNMTLPDNVFPLTTLKINEVEKWKGIGPEQYSSALAFKDDEFSTGLFGTTGIDIDPSNNAGTLPSLEAGMTQMLAADKVYLSSSKTKAYSGGASGNIGLGASMGYSESSLIKPPGSILLQDFTDLNGDGYPDLVTKERIQYSLATGGHKTPQNALVGDYVSVSNNYQNAITLGANFNVKAFKTTGSNSRTGQVSTTAQADNSSPWSAPVGISGSYNFDSKDFGEAYWLDINGDGLLDRISGAGPTGLSSSINYGKGFYGSTAIYNASTYSSYPTGSAGISYGTALTDLISTLAGLNLGFGIDVSAGASKSTGTSEKLFEDINGDGMIDILTVNSGALDVRYNLGNKFADQSVTLTKSTGQNINFSDELETNNGYGSIGAHVYIPIGPIPILPIPGLYLFNMWIKVGADIAGNIGMSMAEVKKGFKDMNGDGYNDLVRYEGNNLIVNYSRIGKTNKLKTVSNQDSKATFTIDYKYTNPDYDDPNARLVMSEVRVFNPDIFSPSYNTPTPDKDMVKRFKYEKSRYDRRERTHLGYERVISEDYDETNIVYRKNLSTYYNQSFHSAGLLKTSELFSNSDVLLSKTENKYDIYTFNSSDTQIGIVTNGLETFDAGGTQGRQKAIVLPSQNITTEYEDGNAIEVSKKMYYNAIGQLIKHEYSSPSLSYHSEISYHSGLPNNIINAPQSIDVYPGLGSGVPPVKHRETEVNSNGEITEIRIQLDSNNFAVTNLGYDSYGNVRNIKYPENENGERYELNYDYDVLFNKYVVQTRNSFDEISYAEYDSSYDVPTKLTDISGNLIEYSYDIYGRLIRVLGPKERLLPNTIYAEKFTAMYFYNLVPRSSGSSSWVYRSNTLHYNADDPYNPIETISFSDGLGRVVQTKKDIEHLGIERMSVSGNTNYDVFGRILKQYHPSSENKAPNPTNTTNFNNYLILNAPQVPFSAVKYDLKDRAIKYTSEDNTDTNTYYKIENNMFKTTTSIIGHNVDNYTDAEGKPTKKVTYANNQSVETDFYYDDIGQLITVKDPENIVTEYTYDMAGRKVSSVHPDRGTFAYTYDPAGNMIKMSTENLINDASINQHFIKYNFNYNRLASIILPDLPNGQNPNNVTYEYGGVGSGNNTGRIVSKTDGTGYSQYEYGNLGELTNEIRAIYGYNIPTMYFNTSYSYDSWNRLRNITYPDGETVNYTYNVGGNLKSVFNNDNYSYINNIKYDQFEQRESISYGNGTKSNFSYNYQNRRLSGHTLSTGVNNPHYILANSYSYDGIGNITSIINSADVSPNQMGGGYEFEYGYDTMSRLTDVRGQFRMKVVRDEVTPPVPGWSPYSVSNSTTHLQLQYNPSGSIAVKSQVHEQDLQINNENTYENYYEYSNHKVMNIIDPNSGMNTSFEYDYNGNVLAESSANGANRLYWDEQDRMKAYFDDNTGVYQYYTYDDAGERTIKYNLSGGSQLYQNGTLVDPGSLGLNDYRVYSSPRIVVNSNDQYSKHYFEGSRRFASRIIDGSDIFSRRIGTDIKRGEDKSISSELDFKTYLEKAGLAGTIETELGSKAPPGSGQAGLYYLHGDHLGTATYVTDTNGETTQFFLNLPFGETMAEQMTGVYENPYKFNAKEIDHETGFYYYGARYYNPKWSLWYGVDPLAEKYPSWSPYNYTLDNPITLIDPDGREPFGPDDPPIKLTGSRNLVIYIVEPRIPLSARKMDKGAKNWDYIGVKSIDEVPGILSKHYGDNMPKFENLAIRSHGIMGGAKLNPGSPTQEFVLDASKSKGLVFLSNTLSNDANILFTACNMSMNYQNSPEVQAGVDSYTDLFLQGDRKFFTNGATSASRFTSVGKDSTPTDETFAFDNDLVNKKTTYAGFMQFNLNKKGKAIYQKKYYNMNVRSSGGFLRTDFLELNKKPIKNGNQNIKK